MAKKKVYVCFDYDRDKHYKYLMGAWDANPNFDFTFNDQSPDEIQSNEICNNLEKKKIFLERSMEIIMKMKFERYKEIFNLLDSDHDGLISSNKIKLSTLDQDLLEAMTPLLEDLQESNETMSFKQFCLKVDKLLSIKIFADK